MTLMSSLPVISPDSDAPDAGAATPEAALPGPTPVSSPAAVGPAPKVLILGSDPAAFDQAVVGWGWPRFRGKQVRDWVFTKLADDPDRMTNLSKADRDFLREHMAFPS